MSDSETPLPAEGDENADKQDGSVEQRRKVVEDEISQVVDPKKRKEAKLAALARWRGEESAEQISPYDFDCNFLWNLAEADSPLKRSDLIHETGLQAVVLNKEDLEEIGGFDILLASGERISIEPESLQADDVLIIYPHELGDDESGA
ncbi:hypothetical protein COU76_03060 [Candidatus Peregrinibacteria bacterium CG10_big_fil_rev_8_21_14_0_10_49_10]|nr:MAG: hypothetical protein COU76_03060 [Candidatus Peregrinibacteria bacterium CG10_big_fil_rev_8_21_14_0_10_49_10]